MAEGKGALFKRLESEVTCPLCFEIFKDPKKFPCDHTYCSKCLHGLILRSFNGRISCPECRKDVRATDFSTPHQINRLLEMYHDGLKSEPTTPQYATCEVHASQPLELFCATCEKLVCKDCVIDLCARKDHKQGYIEGMVKKLEGDLNRELEPVKCLYHEVDRALQTLKTSDKELQTVKTKERRFDLLADQLEQERRYFIESIEKSFQEEEVFRSRKKTELVGAMKRMESIIHSAHCHESKPALITEKMENIKIFKESVKSLDLHTAVNFPKLAHEICSEDDFRNFLHVNDFLYLESDPLKCHTERLNSATVNEAFDVTLHINSQNVKTKTLNITSYLHCCHYLSSQRVKVKKITNMKFMLTFCSPEERKT